MYLFIGKCAICSGWNICPLTRSLRDFIEGNLSEDRCNCFKFKLLNRKDKNFHYIVGPGGAQPLLPEAKIITFLELFLKLGVLATMSPCPHS